MRRLLYLWLTLLAGYWIATATVSIALTGQVARSDLSLLVLLAAPALQAILLGGFTRSAEDPIFPVLPRGTARKVGWVLLAVDVVVGLLGGLFPEEPSLSFRATFGAPRIWGLFQLFALFALGIRTGREFLARGRLRLGEVSARLFEWGFGLSVLAGLGALAGWGLPSEVGQPLYAAGWMAGLVALTGLGGGLWYLGREEAA